MKHIFKNFFLLFLLSLSCFVSDTYSQENCLQEQGAIIKDVIMSMYLYAKPEHAIQLGAAKNSFYQECDLELRPSETNCLHFTKHDIIINEIKYVRGCLVTQFNLLGEILNVVFKENSCFEEETDETMLECFIELYEGAPLFGQYGINEYKIIVGFKES